MEQKTAIIIKTRAQEAIAELHTILPDIKGLCSDEEFEFIKRGVGMSIIKILDELLEPIYQQHPEIDPDRTDPSPAS
jgi:hypothetical protein